MVSIDHVTEHVSIDHVTERVSIDHVTEHVCVDLKVKEHVSVCHGVKYHLLPFRTPLISSNTIMS